MASVNMSSFLDAAARTVSGMIVGRQQAASAFQAEQDTQAKLEEAKVKQQQLEEARQQREQISRMLAESTVSHRGAEEKQGERRLADAEANAKAGFDLRKRGLDQSLAESLQKAQQGDTRSLRQMYTTLAGEPFQAGYQAMSPEDQERERDRINSQLAVIGPLLGQGLAGQPQAAGAAPGAAPSVVPSATPAGAPTAAPSPLAKALATPVPKQMNPTIPQALAAKKETRIGAHTKTEEQNQADRLGISLAQLHVNQAREKREADNQAARLELARRAATRADKKLKAGGKKPSTALQQSLTRITSAAFLKDTPAQKQLAVNEYYRQAKAEGIPVDPALRKQMDKLVGAPAAAGGDAKVLAKKAADALRQYNLPLMVDDPMGRMFGQHPSKKTDPVRKAEAGHQFYEARVAQGASPAELKALNPDFVPRPAPKATPKPAPAAPKRATGGPPVLPQVTSLKGIPAPAAIATATPAARTPKASAPVARGTTPPGPTKAALGKTPAPIQQMDPQLKALAMKGLAGAETAGLHPIIEPKGGVRSAADQKKLYANRANNPNYIAPPGTSTHEAGRGVDISAGVNGTHDQKMEAQQRLAQHMAPQGWRWSGENESMHFTYVGKGNNPYPDDTRHSNLWKAMVDNNADVNALLRSRKTTEDKQHMSELIKEIQQVVHQANPGIQFRDVPLKTQAIEWPQGVDRVNSLMVRWNGRTLPYRVDGNRGIILTPSGKFDMAGTVY